MLVRNYSMDTSLDQTWSGIVSMISSSEVIVNTIDSASHLISFTLPVGRKEIQNLTVEDLKDSDMVAQTVIWARPLDEGRTLVTIRSAIGKGGLFFHSNGEIETSFMSALLNDSPWRESGKVTRWSVDVPANQLWTSLMSRLQQVGWKIQTASQREGVLTLTVGLSSEILAEYVSGEIYPHHSGAAHMTLFLTPANDRTDLTLRTFLVQPGVYGAPVLDSSGVIEAQLREATRGSNSALVSSVPHFEGSGFWHSIYSSTNLTIDLLRSQGRKQHLPTTSIDEAWSAVLTVITQAATISSCERPSGTVVYVATHTTPAKAVFSVHPVMVFLDDPDGLGVDIYAAGDSIDHSEEELAQELRLLHEKIATQLFLKEKLTWLMQAND